MTAIRTFTFAASAAALFASSFFVAPATATPGSGFVPSPIVNGHFGTIHIAPSAGKVDKWGLVLKTLADTDVGADRLTIQPGGFSGWHDHPGAVFITVTQGSITDYDGTDPLCASHTYATGESFIDEPFRTHNVVNASNSAGAEFIAIVIKPVGFVGLAFRLDRPKPTNCPF